MQCGYTYFFRLTEACPHLDLLSAGAGVRAPPGPTSHSIGGRAALLEVDVVRSVRSPAPVWRMCCIRGRRRGILHTLSVTHGRMISIAMLPSAWSVYSYATSSGGAARCGSVDDLSPPRFGRLLFL